MGTIKKKYETVKINESLSLEELASDIIPEVKQSQYWNEKSKDTGDYLQNLTCPDCGLPNAFLYKSGPWAVICNKINSCGSKTGTAKLFGLYEKISVKYPPTKQDPNRPAKVYMLSRGIPENLIDQARPEYIERTRAGEGGGVFFSVGDVKSGRLFNPKGGKGKTHTTGKLNGQFWRLPNESYDPAKPLYLCEGILDALSFFAMGCQAVALVAAATKPEKFNLDKLRNLGNEIISAFDNDEAGAVYTKNWQIYLKEKEVSFSCIMPKKGDWNNLLRNAGTSAKAAERFKSEYKAYETQARLMTAETTAEYAKVYYEYHKKQVGLFNFKRCMYYGSVKNEPGDKLDIKNPYMVGNFTVIATHYGLSTGEIPVYVYYLKVTPRVGRPVYTMAKGTDLKSPDTLKTFFLCSSKTHWTGGAIESKILTNRLSDASVPTVRQAKRMGHDHQSGFRVYKYFAVSPVGKIIMPEKEGYFKINNTEYIKSFGNKAINPFVDDGSPLDPQLIPKALKLIYGAWAERGLVAVAFVVASAFVNDIKPKLTFFPFLSLYGDRSTGKSVLMTALNAIQGMNEEGLPLNGVNTQKGQVRVISQVSGMMKGMVEGNNQKKMSFDAESILPLFNHGHPLQVRAKFTNDNQEEELPFYGTLAFSQNVEQFQTPAAKSRVISIEFREEQLNKETKAAHDELASLSIEELSGFMAQVLAEREHFEKGWKEEYNNCLKILHSTVSDSRIRQNHALILAFYYLLCNKFFCKETGHDEIDISDYVAELGAAKIKACREYKTTTADHLLEMLQELPESVRINGEYVQKITFCHVKDGLLWIHRTKSVQAVKQQGHTLPSDSVVFKSMEAHPACVEKSKKHRFPKTSGSLCGAAFKLSQLSPSLAEMTEHTELDGT